MKTLLCLPVVYRAALSLLFYTCTFTARAQVDPTAIASSSSSYGLLDNFAIAGTDQLSAAPGATRKRSHAETSISLGVFPDLTAPRLQDNGNGNLVTQSSTASAGVLGTFRQSFSPWLGYSVNMGFTRDSTHYTNGATYGSVGTPTNFFIANDVYELSLAYVAQKHLSPKLTAFADIGAGMVAFLPEHRGPDAINYAPDHFRSLVPAVDFRPQGVGGFGIDYHFNRSLAFRAEYRGQLYKYVDYGLGLPRLMTVANQPTLSLAYTFGAGKQGR